MGVKAAGLLGVATVLPLLGTTNNRLLQILLLGLADWTALPALPAPILEHATQMLQECTWTSFAGLQ